MATGTMLMTGVGARLNTTTSRDLVGYVNGIYENNNYASPSFTPSAAAPGAQMALGLAGTSFMASGRRIYGLMMFDKYLSQAEFNALRSSFQRRWPTI